MISHALYFVYWICFVALSGTGGQTTVPQALSSSATNPDDCQTCDSAVIPLFRSIVTGPVPGENGTSMADRLCSQSKAVVNCYLGSPTKNACRWRDSPQETSEELRTLVDWYRAYCDSGCRMLELYFCRTLQNPSQMDACINSTLRRNDCNGHCKISTRLQKAIRFQTEINRLIASAECRSAVQVCFGGELHFADYPSLPSNFSILEGFGFFLAQPKNLQYYCVRLRDVGQACVNASLASACSNDSEKVTNLASSWQATYSNFCADQTKTTPELCRSDKEISIGNYTIKERTACGECDIAASQFLRNLTSIGLNANTTQVVELACSASVALVECYVGSDTNNMCVPSKGQAFDDSEPYHAVLTWHKGNCDSVCPIAKTLVCDQLMPQNGNQCSNYQQWKTCFNDTMHSDSCSGFCTEGSRWHKARQFLSEVQCTVTPAECSTSVQECIHNVYSFEGANFPPITPVLQWEFYIQQTGSMTQRCRNLEFGISCFNSSINPACVGQGQVFSALARKWVSLYAEYCANVGLTPEEVCPNDGDSGMFSTTAAPGEAPVTITAANGTCDYCDQLVQVTLNIAQPNLHSPITDSQAYGAQVCRNYSSTLNCFERGCKVDNTAPISNYRSEDRALINSHVILSCDNECRFTDFWACENLIAADRDSCEPRSYQQWSNCFEQTMARFNCSEVCTLGQRRVRSYRLARQFTCATRQLETENPQCSDAIRACLDGIYSRSSLNFENFLTINETSSASLICDYFNLGVECLNSGIVIPSTNSFVRSVCASPTAIDKVNAVIGYWQNMYSSTCSHLVEHPQSFKRMCAQITPNHQAVTNMTRPPSSGSNITSGGNFSIGALVPASSSNDTNDCPELFMSRSLCAQFDRKDCSAGHQRWKSCVAERYQEKDCMSFCSQNGRQNYVQRLWDDLACGIDPADEFCGDGISTSCFENNLGGRVPLSLDQLVTPNKSVSLEQFCAQLDSVAMCMNSTVNGNLVYFGRNLTQPCARRNHGFVINLMNDFQARYKSSICSNRALGWSDGCTNNYVSKVSNISEVPAFSNATTSSETAVQKKECSELLLPNSTCSQYNADDCTSGYSNWKACVQQAFGGDKCDSFCTAAGRRNYARRLRVDLYCSIDKTDEFCLDTIATNCWEQILGGSAPFSLDKLVNPMAGTTSQNYCLMLDSVSACLNRTLYGNLVYFSRNISRPCERNNQMYVKKLIADFEDHYKHSVCLDRTSAWSDICSAANSNASDALNHTSGNMTQNQECTALLAPGSPCSQYNAVDCVSGFRNWKSCVMEEFGGQMCDDFCSTTGRQNYVRSMWIDLQCGVNQRDEFCRDIIQLNCFEANVGGVAELSLDQLVNPNRSSSVEQYCASLDAIVVCLNDTLYGNLLYVDAMNVSKACGPNNKGYVQRLMTDFESHYRTTICQNRMAPWESVCSGATSSATIKHISRTDKEAGTSQNQTLTCPKIFKHGRICTQFNPEKCGAEYTNWTACVQEHLGGAKCDGFCSMEERSNYAQMMFNEMTCSLPASSSYCLDALTNGCLEKLLGGGGQHKLLKFVQPNTTDTVNSYCMLLDTVADCMNQSMDGTVLYQGMRLSKPCQGQRNYVSRLQRSFVAHYNEAVCANRTLSWQDACSQQTMGLIGSQTKANDSESVLASCQPCSNVSSMLLNLIDGSNMPSDVQSSKQSGLLFCNKLQELSTCANSSCSKNNELAALVRKYRAMYCDPQCRTADIFWCRKGHDQNDEIPCEQLETYQSCLTNVAAEYSCTALCTTAQRFFQMEMNFANSARCVVREPDCSQTVSDLCLSQSMLESFISLSESGQNANTSEACSALSQITDCLVDAVSLYNRITLSDGTELSNPCINDADTISQLIDRLAAFSGPLCVNDSLSYRSMCTQNIPSASDESRVAAPHNERKYVMSVALKLDADFNQSVGADITAVEQDLKIQIAAKLGVPLSSIKNLKISPGSINVEFEIETQNLTVANSFVSTLNKSSGFRVNNESLNMEPGSLMAGMRVVQEVVTTTSPSYKACSECDSSSQQFLANISGLYQPPMHAVEYSQLICREFNLKDDCYDNCLDAAGVLTSEYQSAELASMRRMALLYCESDCQYSTIAICDAMSPGNESCDEYAACFDLNQPSQCNGVCGAARRYTHSRYMETAISCFAKNEPQCNIAAQHCFDIYKSSSSHNVLNKLFEVNSAFSGSANVSSVCAYFSLASDCLLTLKESAVCKDFIGDLNDLANTWSAIFSREVCSNDTDGSKRFVEKCEQEDLDVHHPKHRHKNATTVMEETTSQAMGETTSALMEETALKENVTEKTVPDITVRGRKGGKGESKNGASQDLASAVLVAITTLLLKWNLFL